MLIAVAQPVIDWAPASSRTVGLIPFVNDGGSLTPVTVIVNVCGGLVSMPPFAVPPLSWTVRVTIAEPTASGAGVNVSVPLGLTDG